MEDPQYKLFQSRTCSLDFNEVKLELLNLFRSSNPLSVFNNSQKIKDKFWEFLNCISLCIANGFNVEWDSKTLMYRIYKDAGYDKIWFLLINDYIMESRYFDVLRYGVYMKFLAKDRQFLAVGLYKMYHRVPQSDIEKYLREFSLGKVSYTKVKQIFDEFKLAEVPLKKTVLENNIESFLEQMFVGLWEKGNEFLDRFNFKIEINKTNFKDVLSVMFYIFQTYPSEGKESLIPSNRSKNLKDVRGALEILLSDYAKSKYSFYKSVKDLTQDLNIEEKNIVWKYLRMAMIDTYFPQVKMVYYFHSSKKLCDKTTYTMLKGTLKSVPKISDNWEIVAGDVSPEAQAYFNELQEIYDLKEIVLTLYDNLFSSFLLPLVYYTIGERLVINKDDLWKMKYLLLFVFSKNYSEYKKLFMFFNQLEVFLNFEERPKVYEKIKVWFSYILFCVLILIASYMFLPLGVSLGILILMLIKYSEIMFPYYFYRLRWNVGLKFFAYIFLAVSGYYWLANFDATSDEIINVQKQFESFATYPTRDAWEQSLKYVKAAINDISNKK